MGLNVVAVDVDDAKLRLARTLGASITINALTSDPVETVKKEIGGAHGVLVTAVSRKAFAQAVNLLRRGGTVVLNGLPPGDFPVSIFDVVLNGTTIRGSIVGTRLDLKESLEFATRRQGESDRERRTAREHQRYLRPHESWADRREDCGGLSPSRRSRRSGRTRDAGTRLTKLLTVSEHRAPGERKCDGEAAS